MYRTIDTDTWDDPWFAELDPRSKLLFLYFVTNRRSTPCGCFEITKRAIAFETGLSVSEIDEAMPSLGNRAIWWPEHQVVFVRNFYRHQHGKSNKDNFLKGAIQSLAEFPRAVQSTVGDVYPELVSFIGNPSPTHGEPMPTHGEGMESHTHKETVAVTDAESDAGTVAVDTPPAAPVREAYPVEFEEDWTQIPTGHGSKKKTYEQWRKLSLPDRAELKRVLPIWAVSDRWQRGFVKDPAVWLRDGYWRNPPVANGTRPANGKPTSTDQVRASFASYYADKERREAAEAQGVIS